MSLTAFSGALCVSGQSPAINGMVPDYNPNAAPSMFYAGAGILDPRFGYFDAPVAGYRMLGFSAESNIPVIDAIPYTATVNNISASQAPVSGTALTLVSSSAAGVTVLAAAAQIFPSLRTLPVGTLALDGATGLLQYSSSLNVGIYDPSKTLSRAVVVTTNADDTAGFYTVSGYDIYGYAMSEKITGVNNTVANGVKAFKYITSVTPSGTISSTAVTVGTRDLIGLPIRADYFGDLKINYPDTLVTATTGFVAAVTTTASQTTGDVRGTYALQTASNNSRHLQVFVTPRPTNLISPITGLFGVTQA